MPSYIGPEWGLVIAETRDKFEVLRKKLQEISNVIIAVANGVWIGLHRAKWQWYNGKETLYDSSDSHILF